MKVHLKVPRHLGGKDLRPGFHEIPDELAKDWYTQALIKSGNLVVMDAKFAADPKPKKQAPKQDEAESKG